MFNISYTLKDFELNVMDLWDVEHLAGVTMMMMMVMVLVMIFVAPNPNHEDDWILGAV
jgi:hypothetical protein